MLVSQNVVTSLRNACKFNKLKAKRQHYCESMPQLLCAFCEIPYTEKCFLVFFSRRFQDDLEIDIGYLLVTLTAY